MNNTYDHFTLLILILAINLILSCSYLILSIIKKNYKKGLIITGFMIIVPVIGPVYFFGSWFVYEVFFKKNQANINVDELSLSKERIKPLEKGDMQLALNQVPVEEALIISSHQDARKLLLNILKGDTGELVGSIYKGTDHQDSEVSHYAASAVTDAMDKFKQKESILRAIYLADKNNIDAIESYWIHVKMFLKARILPPGEQERYLAFLEDLVRHLQKNIPSQVRGDHYYTLVLVLLDLEKIGQAEKWVEQGLKNMPDDLDSYKAGLQFYYANGMGDKLLGLIKQLMESSIRIDRETLEFIRFYNQ